MSTAAALELENANPHAYVVEVRSQAELDATIDRLNTWGYTTERSQRESGQSRVVARLSRVAKCNNCWQYVSLINIQEPGRVCPSEGCGAVLYDIRPRPHISFFLVGSKLGNGPRLNMEVVHVDKQTLEYYLSFRFHNSINPGALMGDEAIAYLDGFLHEENTWSLVSYKQEQCLKVGYAIHHSRRHPTNRGKAYLCAEQRDVCNYSDVPVPHRNMHLKLHVPREFQVRLVA